MLALHNLSLRMKQLGSIAPFVSVSQMEGSYCATSRLSRALAWSDEDDENGE